MARSGEQPDRYQDQGPGKRRLPDMTILTNFQPVVKSDEVLKILDRLGWRHFCFDYPDAKRQRNRGLRVNGIPWKYARLIILLEARMNGVKLDPGQLRRVAYLKAAGYFVQGGD